MFDGQLHTDMPWSFLQKLSQFLLCENFQETGVFWDGYASSIWLAASKANIAIGDLDLFAEHIGPKELTLIWAEFTFGEGGEIEDRKHSVAILYLHVLVVVYTLTVRATTDHT